jgi:hypothetical protein
VEIGKFAAFCVVAVVLCVAAAWFLWLGNTVGIIVISAFFLMFIWLTRAIWQGPEADEWSYRKFALRSLIVLSTSQAIWLVPEKNMTATLAGLTGPLPDWVVGAHSLRAIFIFAFISMCLLILRPASTAMRRHPVALQSDFPSGQEQQQLETYCRSLQTQIHILNEETSWVAAHLG